LNHSDVEALRKVDRLDVKARKLAREADDIPEQLEKHKAQARAVAEKIQRGVDEQKRLQREIDKLDLETRSNLEQIKKYQTQQNTAKTNEEYSALKKQIDALKKANGDFEDRALAFYEKLDALKAADGVDKGALREAEKRLKEEEAEVAKEVAVVRKEFEAVVAERTAAEASVGAPNLALYRRILEKHGNRALAEIRGRTCQGCFIEIPPNCLSLLLSGKEVVTCTSCSRILYLESDYRALSPTSYVTGGHDRDGGSSKDGNW